MKLDRESSKNVESLYQFNNNNMSAKRHRLKLSTLNLPQVIDKHEVKKMMNESLYSSITDSDNQSYPEANNQNYEARFMSQDESEQQVQGTESIGQTTKEYI